MRDGLLHWDVVVQADGTVRMIYNELVDAFALGEVAIRRGSHVEPSADGYWYADLSPVKGPRLGPYLHRSKAIEAELEWLKLHWLVTEVGEDESSRANS